MKAFQFALFGYSADDPTPESEDLCKWVVAPNEHAVYSFLAQNNLVLDEPNSVAALDNQEIAEAIKDMNWHRISGLGCDMILNADGDITDGKIGKTELPEDQKLVVCTFASQWTSGFLLETAAKYNPQTGEIVEVDSIETEDDEDELDALTNEYIELENGDELEVCQECHSYTMKSAMIEMPPGSSALEEVRVCSDPDCESHG